MFLPILLENRKWSQHITHNFTYTNTTYKTNPQTSSTLFSSTNSHPPPFHFHTYSTYTHTLRVSILTHIHTHTTNYCFFSRKSRIQLSCCRGRVRPKWLGGALIAATMGITQEHVPQDQVGPHHPGWDYLGLDLQMGQLSRKVLVWVIFQLCIIILLHQLLLLLTLLALLVLMLFETRIVCLMSIYLMIRVMLLAPLIAVSNARKVESLSLL